MSETGRFVLKAEPLPIGDLLRRLAETARAAHAGKELVVAVDTDFDVGTDPLNALGDATLTYSLLSNLIKNACEAAPPRSRVSATLHPGNPLRIDIVNQGTIPATLREHFFDKFLSGGKAGGSGLGAYSARLLARAQAGDVDFAVSDENDTTTVSVTLPSVPSQGH
jgi:two-component system, sensor histidine kinase and response regulator